MTDLRALSDDELLAAICAARLPLLVLAHEVERRLRARREDVE